jgi:hypothetical protein
MSTAVNYRNQAEIKEEGIDALVQRLGRVGAVRFLQLISGGYGDSVKEKHERDANLTMTMDEIAEEIYKMQAS